MKRFYIVYASLSVVCLSAYALECYYCEDEDNNRPTSNCRRKRQQCDDFQDACTSYVRWGVPEHWSARADRRYYISKGCDTKQGCERRQAQTEMACQRDYYNDWACVECCDGDLCNYFIKMGAASIQASILTIAAAFIGLFIIRRQL